MPVVKGKLDWKVGATDEIFRGVTVGRGLLVGAEYPVPMPDQPLVDQTSGVVVLVNTPVDEGGGGGCPVPQGAVGYPVPHGAVGAVPGGRDLLWERGSVEEVLL